jgi:hypothetical protein
VPSQPPWFTKSEEWCQRQKLVMVNSTMSGLVSIANEHRLAKTKSDLVCVVVKVKSDEEGK